MKIAKNFDISIQLCCLSAVCFFMLPYLTYHYPSQISILFPFSEYEPNREVKQDRTEAEMLQDFVEILRSEEDNQLKEWSIEGNLIQPYSTTDLDALLGAEEQVIDTPVHPLRITETKRLCTQKSLTSKKG